MKRKKSGPMPQDIREVLNQIQAWRQLRPKPRKMPDHLWQDAVCLAQKYGLTRIHNLFGLDYTKLRRLVQQAQSHPQDVVIHSQTEFVSFPAQAFFSTPELPPNVLELSSNDGRSLVIRTHQSLDLDALIHSF